MDLGENPVAAATDSAEGYVALIQKQMRRLVEDLADGQRLEVLVPLSNGSHVAASWFGAHNPDMIKVTGTDGEGNDVCLLAHKSTIQVLLRKVSNSRQEVRPKEMFQLPDNNEPQEIVINETA